LTAAAFPPHATGVDNKDLILDQFTRQAVPFSTAPGITDDEALRRLVEATGAGPDDTVLDVACGPGLVVCAFARVVRHATGIDLTPAMLDRARALAAQRGLVNVTWHQGDVERLPWPDATFSVVTSRFAFHHFPRPAAVLAEMRRVCRPGGTVAVADLTASPDPAKARAHDHVMHLIDPSHVRSLPEAEIAGLFAATDLGAQTTTRYRLAADLDAVLARSFPNPGDEVEIRRLFAASADDDGLGLETRKVGDAIRFAYPVVIAVARTPG
jgi:SAM-dependent methyltransferase